MKGFAIKSHYLLKREKTGLAFAVLAVLLFLSASKRMDYRIQEIIKTIDSDISGKLVISDLAVSVNLSVSRLQHLFKREVEMSIVKYINNLRLQKARRLLETSYMHVKEIRLRVGLINESHFQSDFKRKFGKTPNNYRNIFQNSRNGQ